MSSAETKPAADGDTIFVQRLDQAVDTARAAVGKTEVDVMLGFMQASLRLRNTNLQTHATYGDEMQLLHDSMEHARRISNGRVRFAANDPKVKTTVETLVRWVVMMQGMCEIATLRSQEKADANDSLREAKKLLLDDIAKARAERDGALKEVAALRQRVHSLDGQLTLVTRQCSDEIARWREEAYRREDAMRSYRFRG